MAPPVPTLSDPAKRRLMVLVLAIGLGVVALMMFNKMMVGERRKLAAERKKLLENYQSPIEVVVAAKDLPPQTVIESSMLTFAKVPERFAQPYSVRDPNQLVGLMTLVDVAAGEQVLTNKVKTPQEAVQSTTLSTVVPKGKRAVTITVNTLTGVGGFVRPGDLVDILWTLALPGPDKDHPELITLTLFQDVDVVAIQREIAGQPAVHHAPDAEDKNGQAAAVDSGGGEDAEATSSVAGTGKEGEYTATLALNPQDISFLLFAREQGRIQLTLRSKEEEGSKVAVAPVNMTTMMGATLGPEILKANQPKPQRHVEVYKGLNRDVVVLPDAVDSSDH